MSSKSSYREEKVWKVVNFGPNFDHVCQQVCEQKVCDVISRKKSFKVTSNRPNLTVLFDEIFGLNNKRVRRANNGRRHCPSRPQNSNGSVPVFFWSSFDLKSRFWAFWKGFVTEKSKKIFKTWPRPAHSAIFFCQMARHQPAGQHEAILFWRIFSFKNSNTTKIQIFRKNTTDCSQI